MNKKLTAILASSILLSGLAMSSCSGEDSILKNATKIDLTGEGVECSSDSVSVDENNKITISKPGTYAVSGTLDDGQLFVDCEDEGAVNIILNNASITNNDGSCIVIKNASDAAITLYEGTLNTLTDGENYVFEDPEDDEPDAVVFTKEDLTFSGAGKLVVNGNYAGGIYSKDGLIISEGEYEINSADHGIKGKDFLTVNGGNISVHALGDGIKSTNSDNETVGYVEINGGTLSIYSEDEAIQAETKVVVNGGEVILESTNNGIKCAGSIIFNGGSVSIDVQDNALDASSITNGEGCTVTVDGVPYTD